MGVPRAGRRAPRSFRGLREGRGAGFLYRSRTSMGVLMRRPFWCLALLGMKMPPSVGLSVWPMGIT